VKSTEGVRVTEQGGSEGGIDPRLVELAGEPVLVEALVFVNEHPGDGAVQMAPSLGLDLEAAKGALADLRDRKMVERIAGSSAEDPRYRALTRVLWTDEELAELSVEDRTRLNTWIVKMVGADVDRAMAAGTLARHIDTHISRTISKVDEEGWRELAQIQNEALGAIFAAQEAAAERLAERGEEGISVLSAMLCCRLPDGDEEGGRAISGSGDV